VSTGGSIQTARFHKTVFSQESPPWRLIPKTNPLFAGKIRPGIRPVYLLIPSPQSYTGNNYTFIYENFFESGKKYTLLGILVLCSFNKLSINYLNLQ
jgi:hypothetical protein